MSRYTPPCQWDLACVRDAGHDGDHLYPTPDTKPQPSVLPDGAEDTAYNQGYNDGEQAILRAAAPLDVERLAHALHMLHVPGWFNGHRSSDLDLAADIAREYAALEEPTP
jgi:hypothetical protein